MGFVKVSFKDIGRNNHSFSASLYQEEDTNYSFYQKLSDFVINHQKGKEPGSNFYCNNKKYRFIRTSNIEDNSYLFKEDLCTGISEKAFKNYELKKEQILIVKDASVGKVAMLDKNYTNYMICGGIHALTCKIPYYVFAILQHPHFRKNFEKNIPKGSVFTHASDKYLDFDIPLPINNDKKIIKYVENLMESILSKESLIKDKISEINDLISNELNFKGFDEVEKQTYPQINEIIKSKKLYAGFYSKKTKFIKNCITSYKGGYFYINQKNIKSGFTPSKNKRNGPVDNTLLKYKWITTSNVNELGIINKLSSVDFEYKKNNIKTNTCLIINRTSKKVEGESGKFVAISTFYDYSLYGEGQHNQGMYRLENIEDEDLIMIVNLFNHPIYREYFGEISLGSKMKEVKIEDLINVPLPNFNRNIKNKIKNLYYSKTIYESKNLNNENFLNYDNKWSKKAGIYDLQINLQKEKILLNEVVNKIYKGNEIKISYNFMF